MSVGVCITSSCENSFEPNNNLLTMPVASVSPRRFSTTSSNTNTSSALVGSYRSTSTVDRPYYSSTTGSYVNTRTTNTYLSRNLDKTSSDTKRIFSRHSSISDDSGIASSRTSSYSRSSESRDLPPIRRDVSGLSITGRRISSLAVADSVDDMRQKYSPSNYVPNIRKPEPKLDYLNRSKSISNDIGRPPIAAAIPEPRSSVTRNNSKLANNSHSFTNNTNRGTVNGSTTENSTTEYNDNDNNNVLSVSEIRKKFDTATATTNKLTSVIPPLEFKPETTTTNSIITTTSSTGGIGTTITISTNGKHEITQASNSEPKECQKLSNGSANNGNNVRWAFLLSNDNVQGGDESKLPNCFNDVTSDQGEIIKGNHTTNFASYIPAVSYESKPVGDSNLNEISSESQSPEISESCHSNLQEVHSSPGEIDLTQSGDLEMSRRISRIQPTVPSVHSSGSSVSRSTSPVNDLSTSPRLNRATTSITPSTTNGTPAITTLDRGGSRGPNLERFRDDGAGRPSYGGSQSVKHLGLNGLRNIGNTCFMNSVIQCLSNTRYLLEYLRDSSSYSNDINTTTSSMKGALVKAFANVIQELWSGESDKIVNTTSFKSQIQRFAPRFMGFAQQDAQEFLRFFLEGLHEDVNRVTVKPPPINTEIDDKLSDAQKAAEAWSRYLRIDDSAIVDTFVGQLKSSLQCSVCGYCSVTFDPFWDLSLPLGFSSITQCLENFTREETLDGHEKPTCSKCQTRRKCTKSFSIQKFPKILVLHLKRFSPNERFRGKLTTLVDFPLQSLDLSAFAANRGTSSVYNLYAVSNHSGTTYSGHYTAYCKHPYSGDWHEYNDSRVSSISPRNVVSSEAYVLFYELSGHYSHL